MADNQALRLLSKHIGEAPPEGLRALFLNAQYDAALFHELEIESYQPFKPFYNTLPEAHRASELEDILKIEADHALLLAPPQLDHMRYLIAALLLYAKAGLSQFYIAAENNAGGKRLKDIAQEITLPFQEVTKFKSRLVILDISDRRNMNTNVLEQWYDKGQPQQNIEPYITQAGIYGWQKIDTGSRILYEEISDQLTGRLADLGCGYGYLSDRLLGDPQHELDHITCIDADKRALECCRQNLTPCKVDIAYHWQDLEGEPCLPEQRGTFDAVVMNPPFHREQKGVPALGQAFIKRAAELLKPKGVLWMVANAHLPYEYTLRETFREMEIVNQREGFKIIRAVK